jgi:murein DD-endopeptidase MepM/ murein hydrolase activator NlpD
VKRFSLLLALVLLGSLAPPMAAPVVAQNAIQDELAETAKEIERLENLMAQAEGDISYWRNQISSTSGRMNDVLGDLAAAEQTLEDLNLSITDTQAAISFTELEISQKEAELDRTSAMITETHDMVVTQAVELFKQGGGQIQTVFDYQSVQDAAIAVRYGSAVIAETNRALDNLEELRNQKEQQVTLIEEQRAELNGQLSRLDTAQIKAEEQKAIVVHTRALVEAELVHQKALLQTVKNEAAHIENVLAAEEAEQERLIELLAAEQRRGGIAPGELFPPLNPTRIVSPYGPRLHPILGYTRTHAGLDLDGNTGQEIFAAASGTVIYSGYRGGYGNTVIIDHGGGMATLYAHQNSLVAGKGDEVGLGDLIGYVGSTGLSTGPHLHFEVRINGAHTDPAPYFTVL